MAQDATIGKAGLASASGGDGLVLRFSDWRQDGDEVQVRGVIRGSEQSTLADVKSLRDQVAGYGPHNTDEPVVPVTWVQDPTQDGFYRVNQVQMNSEMTGRLKAASDGNELAWSFSADLQRVPGWQAPLFEVVTVPALRVNSHAVAAGTALGGVGLPVGAETTFAPVKTYKSRTSTEGALGYVTNAISDLTYDYSYRATAATFYKGCARVEYSPDAGTTWRSVTGRQVINSGTAVRVSNGLLRVSISSAAVLSVTPYDGSAWDTAKTYALDYGAGNHSALGGWVTILRNDPQKVVVRFGLGFESTPTTSVQPYIDVALGRGERHVELLAPWGGDTSGIARSAVEAATALTGGIRATSNDADGHRYVLALPGATTNDLVNGSVKRNGAGSDTPMMVGVELTGSSAADADTAQNLVYEYLGIVGAVQRIAAR